jgi:Lon protease-like protein
MPEIGLFPLSIVLLPTERVPLHIFEPRYRDLIGEALDSGRPFGIVLAEGTGVHSVGTLANVVEVLERLPDGRLNIVVEGAERFEIKRITEGRSFTTAEVEPFDDEDDPPQPEELAHCLASFERLIDAAQTEVTDDDVGEEEEDAPVPEVSSTEDVAFQLASRVDFGVQVRQSLLEERSEKTRVVRLTELLDGAVEALRIQRLARQRARGNGKVEQL